MADQGYMPLGTYTTSLTRIGKVAGQTMRLTLPTGLGETGGQTGLFRIVKNSSGGTLTPRIIVMLKADATVYGTEVTAWTAGNVGYTVDPYVVGTVPANAFFWVQVEGPTEWISEASVSPVITQGGKVQVTTDGKVQGEVLTAGDTTVAMNNIEVFMGYSAESDTVGGATISGYQQIGRRV